MQNRAYIKVLTFTQLTFISLLKIREMHLSGKKCQKS